MRRFLRPALFQRSLLLVVVPGFVQFFGTRFGVKAVELVKQKKFGYMAALKGSQITAVKIKIATSKLKVVDKKLYLMANKFFG